MNRHVQIIAALLLALSLVACGPGEVATETQSAISPTLDQTAVDAAVEATVSAELTRLASENPSPTPAPTETASPTLPPTEIPDPTPTISPLALDDHALFLADVTIPDGSQVIGGEPFTKTWRIRNIGLNAWTTEYSFVFVNGDQMNGFPVFLEAEVPSGGILEISIPMVAPLTGGVYEGFWMLANADGEVFGIGEAGNQAVLVSIIVIEPTPIPTATPTTAPTATSTTAPTATP